MANLKPELASLNAGSLNFALFHVASKVEKWDFDWEKVYLEGTEDFIFPNTFRTMREFLSLMDASNTKPEFEIYDVGMINNLAYLINSGIAKKPVYLQFVMGILLAGFQLPLRISCSCWRLRGSRSVIFSFPCAPREY